MDNCKTNIFLISPGSVWCSVPRTRFSWLQPAEAFGRLETRRQLRVIRKKSIWIRHLKLKTSSSYCLDLEEMKRISGRIYLEVTRLVNSSKSGKTLRKPPTLSTVSSRSNIAHYPTKRDANPLNKSKKNAIYWKKTCQSHKKRCDKCLKRTT